MLAAPLARAVIKTVPFEADALAIEPPLMALASPEAIVTVLSPWP